MNAYSKFNEHMEGLGMEKGKFPPGLDPIGKGTFRFDCYPGIDCFTVCCKDVDMYLYPYDIIRMKKNLGISSDEFLGKYTLSGVRDNPFFPSVMLRLAEQPDKPCPFLLPQGCSIYEDRPSSCRTYPLERAVARNPEQAGREDHYFLKRVPYCLGHQEQKEWSVKQWMDDQKVGPYNDMNDLWVDVDTIFRTNPWGKGKAATQKLQMAFMACFNVDQFREFVFETSFFSRFDVSEERAENTKTDDVEMMKLGFDWVKWLLTGQPTLTARS